MNRATDDDALEPDLARLAVLAEPARRRLYLYVAPRQEPVGRDEAARAVGISRALAAFHLDRLVEDGLLETEYRRLSGRTGPGAGRPAKLYRRARTEIAVSLPQRDYRLAAQLLAEAIDRPGGADPRAALRDAAREHGQVLGAAARSLAGEDADAPRQVAALEHVLADAGFEPQRSEAGVIRLGNCPFHALATSHRDLTCGMNLAMLDAVLEGLGSDDLTASLDPQPGRCCVAFHPTRPA